MDKLELVVEQILDELDGYISTMQPTYVVRELKKAIQADPSLLESLGIERVDD